MAEKGHEGERDGAEEKEREEEIQVMKIQIIFTEAILSLYPKYGFEYTSRYADL